MGISRYAAGYDNTVPPMSRSLLFFVLSIGYSLCFALNTAAQKTESSIPITVTPFYDADGPLVNIGTFSQELQNATSRSIQPLTHKMEAQLDSLSAVAMFVLAIRLYDLGFRDDAVRWYYRASYRASFFKRIIDPERIGSIGSPAFELKSAHYAFQQLSGGYFNGYAGCDKDKWLATIEQVQRENKNPPNLASIYRSVTFIPADKWAEKHNDTNADRNQLADYIRVNWSEIESIREKNGTNKEYCRD
ncbi:MAG: hypothetical protein H7330_01170 [Hymenobacteraceae bacterium]|nr:hypothetical protein [Hymenobacteraceae bacterium]